MENIQELIDQVLSLKKELEQLKAQAVPIGAVEAFAMKDAPSGWLVCDGGMYSSELYPLLSKALGATYNQPDTPEGFFCVPDLQGLFIRGWDKDGNVDGERDFGTIQEDAFQGHVHDVIVDGETSESVLHYDSKTTGTNTISKNETETFNSVLTPSQHDDMVKTAQERGKMIDNIMGRTLSHFPFGFGTIFSSLADAGIKHSHKLPEIKVGKATNGSFQEVRVSVETRPKNVALRYCIKAM